ncbi:MAG: RNA polymerase-binding protein DksA [Candidatus Accumulibacter sp.]|uniref:RNA polymerase-binding protein DksA n=1 Tax=Accumulibacter sp. TaxID=2053492 RepID=UPI0019E7B6DF|nr:RNA polymerase-binding protein DksA [Accumulibacter sp.]MBE2257948.1 RNA polymerase-binding protein DksA [Paracoccaceae bacterium]MCB1943730.1 RNA polymerase-binding protein DksA [Accumulibacter sp.]MCP5247819.1 RNA polymerase-binding protein DksA [Accumulibacter sp.]
MNKLAARAGAETEATLLAASPDEYMSAGQLAFFRRRLLDEEEALLSAVKETAGHLQESEISSDWNDRASTEEEHTLELRVRDRERKLLQKIRESLRRIDEGNYGWCEETGEPIGIARLLARPTAALCLEAQERREQSKRRFGG